MATNFTNISNNTQSIQLSLQIYSSSATQRINSFSNTFTTNNLVVSDNISVAGVANIQNIGVNGDVVIGGNSEFNNNSSISGDLIVSKNMFINGTTTFIGGFNTSGAITGASVSVNTTATNTINIAGSGTSALNVGGSNFSINTLGNIVSNGGLSTLGTANFSNGLNVSNKFISDSLGNTTFNGILNALNTTNLLNGIKLDGSLGNNTNTLTINGNNGNITTNGTIALNNIANVKSGINNNSKFTVDTNGNTIISGSLTVQNSDMDILTVSNLSANNGKLSLNNSGVLSIDGNLTINNNITSSSNLTISGNNINYNNNNIINAVFTNNNTISANKLYFSNIWKVNLVGSSPSAGQALTAIDANNAQWSNLTVGNINAPLSSTTRGIAKYNNISGTSLSSSNIVIDILDNVFLTNNFYPEGGITTSIGNLSISSSGNINFNNKVINNFTADDSSNNIIANRLYNTSWTYNTPSTSPTIGQILTSPNIGSDLIWSNPYIISIYTDSNTSTVSSKSGSVNIPSGSVYALITICGGGGGGGHSDFNAMGAGGGGAGGCVYKYPINVSATTLIGATINYTLGVCGNGYAGPSGIAVDGGNGGTSTINLNNFVITCDGGIGGEGLGNGRESGNVLFLNIATFGVAGGDPNNNGNDGNFRYNVISGGSGAGGDNNGVPRRGGNTIGFTGGIGISGGPGASQGGGGGASGLANGGNPGLTPNGSRGSGGGGGVGTNPSGRGGDSYIEIVFLRN